MALLCATTAQAGEATIEGTVQSKCIINTDVNGIYGNPSPDKLSTISTDGGVEPIIRFDVAVASYYAAKVVYDATTEFDLTVAGSTWFKVSSAATYGFGRSFPGGTYVAVVQAECIAK